MNNVVIYGAAWCGYCQRAKKLAVDYGMLVDYRDVDQPHHQEKFKAKFPDAKTIPQILLDGKAIGGFDEFASIIENEYGNYGQAPC